MDLKDKKKRCCEHLGFTDGGSEKQWAELSVQTLWPLSIAPVSSLDDPHQSDQEHYWIFRHILDHNVDNTVPFPQSNICTCALETYNRYVYTLNTCHCPHCPSRCLILWSQKMIFRWMFGPVNIKWFLNTGHKEATWIYQCQSWLTQGSSGWLMTEVWMGGWAAEPSTRSCEHRPPSTKDGTNCSKDGCGRVQWW